jgi:L-ribulose-5-phosphate 4-epimerase
MSQRFVNRESKEEVLLFAKQLSELKLCPLTQGNVSIRDAATGLIVITPHDLPYDNMTIDDLVVIDLDGKVHEGSREPSSEWPVHCDVYRERKEVNGVIHSEPIYSNAFGAIHKEIAPIYVNMAIDVGGSVPVMPFTDSGNTEFGKEMLRLMGNRNAIIWANHGMLTCGKTLKAAFHCTVMVEICAEMYHIALCHGNPIAIPKPKIDLLIETGKE